jgi:hypothetical protein
MSREVPLRFGCIMRVMNVSSVRERNVKYLNLLKRQCAFENAWNKTNVDYSLKAKSPHEKRL